LIKTWAGAELIKALFSGCRQSLINPRKIQIGTHIEYLEEAYGYGDQVYIKYHDAIVLYVDDEGMTIIARTADYSDTRKYDFTTYILNFCIVNLIIA
jgi:hypothetical protein